MGGTPHSKEVSLQLELRLLQKHAWPRADSWWRLPGLQEGKRAALLKAFFFFLFSEQHTDIWPVLKSSRKSLWFQLPCFKSNAVGLGLVGGRRPEGTVIQSKWAECLYPLYILRFSFHCVPLFRNAMDKMSKSAMVYIRILCVSVVRNRGTQSTALPCGLQLPSLHSHTFQLSWGQL